MPVMNALWAEREEGGPGGTCTSRGDRGSVPQKTKAEPHRRRRETLEDPAMTPLTVSGLRLRARALSRHEHFGTAGLADFYD